MVPDALFSFGQYCTCLSHSLYNFKNKQLFNSASRIHLLFYIQHNILKCVAFQASQGGVEKLLSWFMTKRKITKYLRLNYFYGRKKREKLMIMRNIGMISL